MAWSDKARQAAIAARRKKARYSMGTAVANLNQSRPNAGTRALHLLLSAFPQRGKSLRRSDRNASGAVTAVAAMRRQAMEGFKSARAKGLSRKDALARAAGGVAFGWGNSNTIKALQLKHPRGGLPTPDVYGARSAGTAMVGARFKKHK